MTLSGGIADKFGNRYEGRWTAACIADVMGDVWSSIVVEPTDGAKIEFTGMRADGVAEHHQAKRRAPDDSWSLASLDREGLLEAAVRWTEPGHEFHLVTSSPVGGGLLALADHARLAENAEAFTDGLGDEAAANLDRLRRRLPAVAPERVWQMLARLHVHQVDEGTVARFADAQLNYLVDGDPTAVRLLVTDFAIAEVRHPLTPGQFWRHLDAQPGMRRRDWGRDPGIRATVDRRRARFVDELDASTIAGRRFLRHAAVQVADRAVDGTHRIVLLSAPAGMGKSVTLREATAILASRSLVLPFRLDHVMPNVEADAIGRALGLPGSPATVLAHLAGADHAVLVIDQLDAVSQVSGRNPEAFSAVEEMVSSCIDRPNVTVVLACRSFDLDADPRLRRLRDRPDATIVDLGPLSDEEVNEVLSKIGIGVDDLSRVQREIIRVPLHLRLLAEAPAGRRFHNEVDLFEAYWAAKRDAVRARGGNDQAVVDVVACLADAMSERQALSVPAQIVDRWRPEVAILRSEQVLVGDDPWVGFFHEAFFDFAFARSFLAANKALTPFLLSTDQGLFRRSQVRQVLAFERSTDPVAYLRDLRDAVGSRDIRFHLKALILGWLANVDDAWATEWALVRELITGSDEPLAAHAVGLLTRAPSLFDRADDAGDLGAWLRSENDLERQRTFWILGQAQRRRATRVTALLRGIDCVDSRNHDGLAFVARIADLTLDEAFLDVFLDLLRRGCLDGLTTFTANGSAWDLTRGLAKNRPAWAARFIGAYVGHRMHTPSADAQNPFEAVPDPIEHDLFVRVARGAPFDYVQAVLPIVLTVIRESESAERDGRIADRVWPFRFFGAARDVRFGLIEGLETALSSLAATQPDDFAPVRDQLVAANACAADDLLLSAYAAAPAGYAKESADWILANPRRLETGYADSPYWKGRELVAAVWPYLGPTDRAAIEAMLLGFFPDWERSVAGYRSHGQAQFTMIDAIPEQDLGRPASRRLAELRRKFGAVHGPRGIVAGWVGSPVPSEKVPRLMDDQWLSAMRRYATEAIRPDRPLERRGGLRELAGQLHEATRAAPERFAWLGLRLPLDVHPAYPEAILRGLADSAPADPGDVVAFARWCHALPGRPCGRWIADAIARHVDPAVVPADIVELVAWYATSDPDEGSGLVPDDEAAPRLRLLEVGINMNRGRAAGAIARLLREGAPLVPWKPTIVALAGDRSEAVRASAAETLLAALRLDRDWVAEVTVALAAGRPQVASSVYCERLLWLLTLSHPHVTLPILEELIGDDHVGVARVGGRLAALAGLASADLAHLAARALAGSASARLGVAEVYAERIGDDTARVTCRTGLVQLFCDKDAKVRSEAATAFQQIRGEALAGQNDLVAAFIESPALVDHPDDLLDAFLASSVVLPDLSIRACLRVLDAAGPEAGSIASAWSARMPDVASIAVRVYAYGTPEARAGALSVIDRLAEVSAYGLDRAIEQLDR